jgi:hypothetical protein
MFSRRPIPAQNRGRIARRNGVFDPGSSLFTILSNAWGGNEINTIVTRNGIVTDLANNIQYVGWYKYDDGRPYLAKRTVGSSVWTTRQAGTGIAARTDLHNYLSMGVDGAGRLHICYNMHNDPMRYWRGTGPGDIAFDTTLAPPIVAGSPYETSVTYPWFIRWPGGGPYAAGDLLLFFRSGVSGDGNLILYRWDYVGQTWSLVNLIFDGDTDNVSFYPNSFVLDSAGTIHIAGVVRETPAPETNRGLYYMKSLDGGVTWKKSDGSAYALPIRDAQLERIITIPLASGVINSCGMCVDGSNRPIIAFYQDFEQRWFTQPQVCWFNGTIWQRAQVSRNIRRPFKLGGLGGQGDSRGTMTRPVVVHKSGYTYMLYSARALGPGFFCSVSTNLSNWMTFNIGNTVDVGNTEAVFDLPLWERDGKVNLIHQFCRNDNVDPGPQTISVFEWTPGTGVITPDTDAPMYDASGITGAQICSSAEAEFVELKAALDDDNATLVRLINRKGSGDLINASSSDLPMWERATFVVGAKAKSAIRFTKASTVWLTCDSVAAAFSGINVPFTFICVLELVTQTNGDTIFSLGRAGNNAGYVRVGTAGTGDIFISRTQDSSTTALTALSNPGLYALGQRFILTIQFDGLNASGRINGAPIAWSGSTDISRAGTMTPDQATLGAFRRTGVASWCDMRLASPFLANALLSLADVRAVESGWAADYGISVVP